MFALAMSAGDFQVSVADTVRVLTGQLGEAVDFVTWYAVQELQLPGRRHPMVVPMGRHDAVHAVEDGRS